MAAGIAFVALYVVGVIVTLNNSPDIKKHDSDAVAARKFVTQLSDSGHRAGILVGAYMIVLGAIAFVWFAQGLRALVASEPAGRLVAGLGVLAAAGIGVGAIVQATEAGAIQFGSEPVPQNGDTIRVLMDAFFPMLFVLGGLVMAAIIAIVAIRGRGALPTWLLYTAWLGVLGGIFAVIFAPLVLPLLWFLVVAIVVLARPRTAETAP